MLFAAEEARLFAEVRNQNSLLEILGNRSKSAAVDLQSWSQIMEAFFDRKKLKKM